MANTPLLLLSLLAVASVSLATCLFVRKRRSRARMAATLTWISALQLPLDTFASRRDGGHDVDTDEPVGEPLQVRILRAQVRSLEETLEQELLGAAIRSEERAAGLEQVAVFQRRVLTTIGAIGRQVGSEPAAVNALDRVAAAVDRLAMPAGFERPALSPAGTSTAHIEPGASLEWSSTPTPGAEHDVDQAAPVAEQQTAAEEIAAAPAEPEVVLPVPPVAKSTTTAGGRRWFRRAA